MIARPDAELGSVRIDLRRAVAQSPRLALDLEGVSDGDRAAAREHWRIHMTAEFASSRVFAGLVPQLMAAGLDYEHVREAVDMARQEVDHGLESARVYAALGGDPCSDLPALDPVPSHPGASPLEAVLRNVVSVSCCGETLAVAIIGAERERATAAPLQEILTRILSDEVGHARFGWRVLREVAPALDETMCARMSAYLVAIFERDLRAMRATITAPPASDAALGLGAPDGPLMWTSFWQTMTQVSVPGLERHRLRATWAWNEAVSRVAGAGEVDDAATSQSAGRPAPKRDERGHSRALLAT